jgi:hypothetical protein
MYNLLCLIVDHFKWPAQRSHRSFRQHRFKAVALLLVEAVPLPLGDFIVPPLLHIVIPGSGAGSFLGDTEQEGTHGAF